MESRETKTIPFLRDDQCFFIIFKGLPEMPNQ